MAHATVGQPSSFIEPVVDRLHGVDVVDPYRWLENQTSERTRRWVDMQTAYTQEYFAKLPWRMNIRQRVSELLLTQVLSEPRKIGDQYFFSKRVGNGERPSIVVRNGISGSERVLIDPESRGGVGAAVSILTISDDGRYLAYSIREGGTDLARTEVFDVIHDKVLPDQLPEGMCTGFVFAPDASGFYYAQRNPRETSERKTVRWHSFGTNQADDLEIFDAGDNQNVVVGVLGSATAMLLLLAVVKMGKDPLTSVYLRPIAAEAAARLLVSEVPGCFVPFFAGNQLLAFTDVKAPNCRIVKIDMDDPEQSSWRDLVPETHLRMQQFAVAGDTIFVTRSERFSTWLEAYQLEDGSREEIPVAPCGSLDLLSSIAPSDTVFFSWTSITEPPSIYGYDTRTKKMSTWQKSAVPFDRSTVTVEEVEYRSKDGTLIPMFLAAREDLFRKDLLHKSLLPTFLTGYGGFGTCVTPRFSAFATYLIEQGFLYAVPALRGGSELGESWHRAGMRELRQNAFDDFIAAAEWLLSEGISAEKQIAIGGGSNAGLLVGAAVTQRPDLFRAAICLGPLLDMTRYHLFDLAAGWAEEYGSPDDEQDFHSLLGYSPYHRVQDGAAYPAVLLISGDADTRCNPMHARKMTARLQAANGSAHPILLDYKPAWGHTPVQPLSVKIDSLTDRLAFICHELGISVQQRRAS